MAILSHYWHLYYGAASRLRSSIFLTHFFHIGWILLLGMLRLRRLLPKRDGTLRAYLVEVMEETRGNARKQRRFDAQEDAGC